MEREKSFIHHTHTEVVFQSKPADCVSQVESCNVNEQLKTETAALFFRILDRASPETNALKGHVPYVKSHASLGGGRESNLSVER